MGQSERKATSLSEPNALDGRCLGTQSAALYRRRAVPADWYVDPADPEAAERFREFSDEALEAQATTFLAADEPDPEVADAARIVSAPAEPGQQAVPEQQAVWIGVPSVRRADPIDDGELAWQADALCAQTDPEAFFPEKGGSTRDAKKVCAACTVRSECLEYALSNDERFGIWGGLSERERRRLRKRAV